MTEAQIANAMYEERTVLLDRIQFYETSARHFNEDWRARRDESLEGYIACAKARLEHIDRMIARFEECRRNLEAIDSHGAQLQSCQ